MKILGNLGIRYKLNFIYVSILIVVMISSTLSFLYVKNLASEKNKCFENEYKYLNYVESSIFELNNIINVMMFFDKSLEQELQLNIKKGADELAVNIKNLSDINNSMSQTFFLENFHRLESAEKLSRKIIFNFNYSKYQDKFSNFEENIEILNESLQYLQKEYEDLKQNIVKNNNIYLNNIADSIGYLYLISFIFLFILIIVGFNFNQNLYKRIVKVNYSLEDSIEGKTSNLNDFNESNDEIFEIYKNIEFLNNKILGISNVLKKSCVNVCKNGKLSYRINDADYRGYYKELIENMNNIFSSYEKDLKIYLDTIIAFEQGNFNVQIPDFDGEKFLISNALNTLKFKFLELNSATLQLIEFAKDGNLNSAISLDNVEGDWKNIFKNLNNLLKDMAIPINDTIRVVDAMSNGIMNIRMEKDYKGDYLILKNSLNKTIETLEKYIINIGEVLNKISNKNLDIDVSLEYVGEFFSIKEYMLKIANNLNSIISEIYSSSEEIRSDSIHIANSSQELAMRTQQQNYIVTNLVSSVDIISEQTIRNVKNADLANQKALETNQKASICNNEMQDMLNAMEQINLASKNISKIIKVIDDIAFQTNLLALNAAVEAARAGQHGKGFAVVAEEVRNLATRSKNAAKETEILIEGTIKRVTEGSYVADITAKTLVDIVQQITDISSIVSKVAEASIKQSDSVKTINQSINKIFHDTQVNSATSENQVMISKRLSDQSELFNEMVSKFKMKDNTFALKIQPGNKLEKKDCTQQTPILLEDKKLNKNDFDDNRYDEVYGRTSYYFDKY